MTFSIDHASPDGILAEMTLRLRLNRKSSQSEASDLLVYPEPEVTTSGPYRGRASTDSWLHQNRIKKLRLKGTFKLERRMSIAMRGESTGF